MAGVKISEATLFDNAQLTDRFPVARGAASGALTVEKVLDQLTDQGYLKGDPSAIYVQNQSDNRKWQLGQKGLQLATTTSPDHAIPDLAQNDTFFFQPSTVEFELQTPVNAPSMAELGSFASAMYFKIHCRNATSGTSGKLTFGSDYVELPGSKPYLNSGTNRLNIIHCWYVVPSDTVYYKIENQSPSTMRGTLTELVPDGSDEVTPDLVVSHDYFLTLGASDVQINFPDNAATPGTRYRIYVFQGANAVGVTFDGSQTQVGNEQVGQTNATLTVIDFVFDGLDVYYWVKPPDDAPGEEQVAEGVITSAQILASNTSPVELIPAPGAGKIIVLDSVSRMNDTGTNYATNINSYIRHNGQISTQGLSVLISSAGNANFNSAIQESQLTSTFVNKSIIFETNTDDPTAGTFDIWYSIKYRIIDDPFA